MEPEIIRTVRLSFAVRHVVVMLGHSTFIFFLVKVFLMHSTDTPDLMRLILPDCRQMLLQLLKNYKINDVSQRLSWRLYHAYANICSTYICVYICEA